MELPWSKAVELWTSVTEGEASNTRGIECGYCGVSPTTWQTCPQWAHNDGVRIGGGISTGNSGAEYFYLSANSTKFKETQFPQRVQLVLSCPDQSTGRIQAELSRILALPIGVGQLNTC